MPPKTIPPHPSIYIWLNILSDCNLIHFDLLQKIKQVEQEGPDSKLPNAPNVSMDRLNRINLRIIEEDKQCLLKPEADKESVGKPEEVSLSSPEKTGADHSESLSDSLYDSFSSCASQASNEV